MILPTMTLDEIYDAIFADWHFCQQKLALSVKQFGRGALKANRFPYCKKFIHRNYKSNIEYTMFLVCHKRGQWNNPLCTIYTTYVHDDGTTAVSVSMGKDLCIQLYTSHFWSRFRERYLEKSTLSTQDTIDFFFRNAGTYLPTQNGVIREDEKYFAGDNIEYYVNVTSLGVCYCEREKDNAKYEVFNTFLPFGMLRQQQNRDIATETLFVYFRDYMVHHPKEALMIDKMLDDFCELADNEKWSIDKFISEGEKLMDKYPIYLM